MSRARVVLAVLSIIIAVVLQTTVFGAGRIQPLGVAPALVTLALILVAPYVEAEYHLLLGFTAGILMDLMGSGTLGLWAMSMSVVAYAASRLRRRFVEGPLVIGAIVFGLTVVGQLVFVFVGTLFGQMTVTEPRVVAKIVLPGVWNLLLAWPVSLAYRLMFRTRERGWAT